MLFTDSVFITQEDLTRLDAEVIAVAESEGIILNGYNGVLRSAVEETSNELQKMIISFGGYLNAGDMTANHVAAVMNVGIGNSVRMKVGMQQIVVSGDVPYQWTHLKQWCVFFCLKTFYRNVFARKIEDRYKAKMEFFDLDMNRRVLPNLWALGIPIVLRPLVRPAATFEIKSGTWDDTNVSLASGFGTLDTNTSLDVAITYVDQSQGDFYVSADIRNNCESATSDPITIQMQDGMVVSIDITSLSPPTGRQSRAQVMLVVVAPLKATGWNVYVGGTGGTLYLQNSTPIPIATKTYELAGDPVLSGHESGLGQYADRRLSLIKTRQRG